MAETTRTIRRRLKSIAATKKITRAMELVAAAKLRRASQAALAARPYALTAWAILEHLSSVTNRALHPLLAERTNAKETVVVMMTDRGLVGGLNSQLLRTILVQPVAGETSYITVGKRAEGGLRRTGRQIVAAFTDLTDRPSLAAVRPIAKLTIDEFRTGAVDRVSIIYPDFVSTLRQVPRVKQLLPFTRESIRRFLEETAGGRRLPPPPSLAEFTFEPTPDAVLELMLTRFVGVQLYQALLEASASEHAARLVAMRNATEAAGDLQADLTLAFNQSRQQAITKDLTEISASRTALET